MSETAEETVTAEAETQAVTKSKKGSGDLIVDVAQEIESLSKTKALNQAEKLSEDIEGNYFKLGGLLRRIKTEQWFDGSPNFESFVGDKFGFALRKAEYLMSIYTHLVDKQIPWQHVCGLGWAKLKDLAPIITNDNIEEWVTKASACTVSELQALIKASKGEDGTKDTTVNTSSGIVNLKFKLQGDQVDVVQTALAKAKGELTTDHDTVALAGIASQYLANGGVDMVATMKTLGYEKVLEAFEVAFPHVNLSVDSIDEPAADGAGG